MENQMEQDIGQQHGNWVLAVYRIWFVESTLGILTLDDYKADLSAS